MSRKTVGSAGGMQRRSDGVKPAGSSLPAPNEQHSSSQSGWESVSGIDDLDLDFDPAELREFLAADLLEVQADPVFKERLRQKLWRFVRARYGADVERDED